MLNPEIVDLQEQDDVIMAEGFVENVYKDLDDIKHSFFRIGFRLCEANKLKYYKALGYQSITELAEDKFGFKKTATYELMQVYELAHSEQAPMQLADKYDKYSKSQLAEFCKVKCLSSNFMEIVSPTDTVADIREAVKIWNKHYYNCYSNVHSIAELIAKYGEPQEPAIQSGTQKQLPGQTVIDLSEVQSSEEYDADVNFSGYAENSGVADGAETVAEAPAPIERSKAEIIKVGLTGVDIYVKDAKFLIYDRYRNDPIKGSFSEYIKSVYNYDNKPSFYHGFAAPDLHRSYSEQGVEFIAFDPYQNVKLNWEEAARHISELIYTDEYLSETEQEQYIEWKAERDGLVVNVEPAAEPQLKIQSNLEFIRTACITDIAKAIAERVTGLPSEFGKGMPDEDRLQQWLQIWLM